MIEQSILLFLLIVALAAKLGLFFLKRKNQAQYFRHSVGEHCRIGVCKVKPVAVDPKTTTRAAAYELWMNAPNPMVTFFKTLDVTPLVRLSRRRGLKFNMLLCWCIGRAASGIGEF